MALDLEGLNLKKKSLFCSLQFYYFQMEWMEKRQTDLSVQQWQIKSHHDHIAMELQDIGFDIKCLEALSLPGQGQPNFGI